MKFISITQRLLIWFLLITLLPLLLVGYSLLRKSETELQQSAENKISTIADKKVDQIDTYFDGLLNDAYIIAQGNTSRKAVVELSREFFRGGPESAAYRQSEAGYRDFCKRFLGVGKYYDLFLISPQGTVVYSQQHEADFATNLYRGPYRNSGLGKVVRNALLSMESGISEFELYAPSGNVPAAFIAVPLNVQGKVVGVFALQVNSQHVYEVLLDNTGMGDSGETLVAHREDEHTVRMVAPLKSTPDAALKMTIAIDQQHTLPLVHALNGERGSGYEIDYLGKPVVAAWRYLPRMDWGMVVKMDSAEALAPVRQMRIFALAIVALALAVSLLGAILLARRVVIPLQNLRDGAQQMAAGKPVQRVQVYGQDELGQLANSFNAMVEQLQISFAEMKDAKEEAERANAAKSDFLSRMSHELRTPLNAILGFGQLLESDTEHPLTQTQIGNIREILQGGNHLLHLINEVLDLSRIESGRLEIYLEAVNIAPLIESCMKQLQSLADKHAISFVLDLSDMWVMADAVRLKQVMINLLSNAIKYNREGGCIQVSCFAPAGQRLRISVQDSGNGIPAAMLSRLFQPFERMATAYEGEEGTGIGLALSKMLVEAMHGKIGVYSVPGTGSTFWFELPLCEPDVPGAKPLGEGAADTGKSAAGQYKVLYVEDNPANLRLVQKILDTRKNVQLLAAANAEVGLEVAMYGQPDLILLDINLPGMGGFEAIQQLKINPVTRDIPVIAVTSNAMARDIERGRAAGFAEYLTKPLDVKKFLQTLDQYLMAKNIDSHSTRESEP